MRKEQSCGIIPIRKIKSEWQLLLIKHGKGHWAFPKGHPEENESLEQTALRELFEETGLHVISFLNIPPQEERYFFHAGSQLVEKRVIYFAALVSGKVILQKAEISEFKWISIKKASEIATFSQTKALCSKIFNYLMQETYSD